MTLINFLSWSATFSNICFFSTGIVSCKKIMAQNSTENVPYLPFLITSFSCFMWTMYGITRKDSTIAFVNVIGMMLQCLYLICHFIYSKTEPVFRHTVYIVLLTCSLLVYLKMYIIDEQESINMMGLACCFITVIMFASPLATLAKIFQTKSTQTLSFPLSFMTVANSSLWFSYGYLINDVFVQVPNFLGLMLGLLQVSLFFWIIPQISLTAPILKALAEDVDFIFFPQPSGRKKGRREPLSSSVRQPSAKDVTKE